MLLLVVITASMATLTLGLLLRAVTSQPYQQTRAATAGPDVVASSVGYTGRSTPVSPAMLNRFAALADARGVIAHSGPYPVAWPVLRTADGMPANVMAEGRDAVSAAVDQPEVVQGTWVRPGGVVLERAFADTLGVGLGDRVTLSGKPFRVIGIAVTAAVPVYSQICFFGGCSAQAGSSLSFDTGLAWLTRSDARALAAPGGPLSYYLNLRLADPAAASAFVDAHQPPQNSGPLALTAWQSLRDVATHLVQDQQQVLAPASLLLGLLAVASIAVVAGARIAEQDRRVGLLKAVGGTPALAAAVLLAEHAAIALAAAAAGLAAGGLAAPLLTGPGASLVGSPGAPSLTITTVLIVVGAAVAVTCAATLIPAVRAARVSTVSALAAAGRTPRRWAWLVRASAWLPVPLLLAVRLTGRRAAPCPAERRQLRGHGHHHRRSVQLPRHNRPRRGAGRAVRRAAGPDARPDQHGAAGRDDRDGHPRRRQRDLYHMGDSSRLASFVRHRALPGRNARTGSRRPVGRATAARPRRSAARHPGGQ